MEPFVYLALLAPVTGLCRELLCRRRHPKAEKNTLVLYMPGVYRAALHTIGLAFGAFAPLCSQMPAPELGRQMAEILVGCILMIECFAWMTLRFRLILQEEVLHLTPYVGRARSLPLSRIVRVGRNPRYGTLILHTEKGIFCRVSCMCVGYKPFRQLLEERGLMA